MPTQWGVNPAVSPSVFLLHGLHADRPLPSANNINYFYWEDDTPGGKLFRSTGSAWEQLLGGITTDADSRATIAGPVEINSVDAGTSTEYSDIYGSLTITEAVGSRQNFDAPLTLNQTQDLPFDSHTATAFLYRNGSTAGATYVEPMHVIRDDTDATAPHLQTRANVGGTIHNRHTLGKEGGIGIFEHAPPTVQPTGGAATAAGTYGATEQGMLQKVYDALRGSGFLS